MQVCLILSLLLFFKLMPVDCTDKDQKTTSSQEAGGVENELQVMESIDSVDNTREHKEDIGQSSKSMLNANSAPRKCDLPLFYHLRVRVNNVDKLFSAAIENCIEVIEQFLAVVYHDQSMKFDHNEGVEIARSQAIKWANLIFETKNKWFNALRPKIYSLFNKSKGELKIERILDPKVNETDKDQKTTSSQEAGGKENELQVMESIDSVDNTREHKEDIGQSSESMLNANSAPRECNLPQFYSSEVLANNVDEPLRAAIKNCMEVIEQLLNTVYHDKSLKFDDDVVDKLARKQAIEWANLIFETKNKWFNALRPKIWSLLKRSKEELKIEKMLDPKFNKKLDKILKNSFKSSIENYSILKERAYMLGESGPCDFLEFSLLVRAHSILKTLFNDYKDPIHNEKYNTSDKMVSEQMTPLKFYYLSSVCFHLRLRNSHDPAISIEIIDHSKEMEKTLEEAGKHFSISSYDDKVASAMVV